MAKSIFVAHVEIVHGCQLQCVGCPNSTLRPKIRPVPVEDFARVLGNIDVEKIHTLRLFNFGEPLLHPDLSAVVARIPEQKWSTEVVELSTNAQHVYWDDFAAMLKLRVVNRLVVSCDGDGTAESYELLRPPSRWDVLLEFLERVRELRDRWSPGTELITRTICDASQPEARQRWRELLEARGWTPEFRRWMLLPEAVANMTNRAVRIPDGVCSFLADPDAYTNPPWDGEMNLLFVDTDGSVLPCCFHPRAGVLGNLSHGTYNEMLRGEPRASFIQCMRRDRAKMRVCGACDVGPLGNEGPSFWAGMDVS